MNETHMEMEARRTALPPVWRALSYIEGAGWILAAAGTARALTGEAGWTLPLLAVAVVASIEAAVGCYATYLQMAKTRLERKVRETRRETAELQALAAVMRAEIAAEEARRYEKLRYQSQLRMEACAQEAAERQRKVEAMCLDMQIEQLRLITERTELRVANIQLRLEQAELGKGMSVVRQEAEEKLVRAYASGYLAGKSEVGYTKARHLRLVEDTA
ncbi:hypothetical protein ACFUJU_28925 [Streptomyces sp. NPDC057235]|uniref:hypothetical protein n=1 Tax=Streptomyces sp. NPDC057235 TaxID=3346058 RepID=UPI0036250994